ncbi:unnamed protein product [Notodromas monacha]|uniref:DFDF domain-containing protein n=1 Tax=Notodromas monacha TaxID=399045 RepID=A0A7R9GDN4_9CRUS|nr:unnamed protein product [Notodromas monacha]CAG0918714.1 unnamed protein product [Notodromas monacha]
MADAGQKQARYGAVSSDTSPPLQRSLIKPGKLPPSDYWKGILVSVESEFDTFQGFVERVGLDEQTVSLTKTFVNGKMLEANGGKATLSADKITVIKFLRFPEEEEPEQLSVVGRDVPKRFEQRRQLDGSPSHDRRAPRTSGCKYNGAVNNRATGKNCNPRRVVTSSHGQYFNWQQKPNLRSGESPQNFEEGKSGWKKRQMAKDSACFGTPVDSFIDEDFDFDANLKKFDKRAVFEEISAHQKPGTVKRQLYYRHDECIVHAPNDNNYKGTEARSISDSPEKCDLVIRLENMADAGMKSADHLVPLDAKPKKGILKNSSSFDKPGPAHLSGGSKETKWDEMNILATHHPPDKDYGHMKVMEPKTPFSYYNEADEEMEGHSSAGLDPSQLASQIGEAAGQPPKVMQEEDEDDEDYAHETEEDRAKRLSFEAKRKAHYKEFYAAQLARKLMERDELEEDDGDYQEPPQP